MKIHTRSTY